MRIDDFIDASNRAASPEQVFDLFQQAAAGLGYDRIMYRALRNHPDTELPCTARSYPDEWIDHYVARGYVHSDPVRRRVLTSGRPFLWGELAATLARDEALIFAEACEAGLNDGAAVPIHGPGGECVGIGFASSQGGADCRAALSTLQMLAVQFHTAYSALTLPRADPPVRLTAREREILQWCAAGKSAWAIGQILGIAEHSVEWHLRNVFRKLGVDSRITAVVKGLHLGLIGL